jgi:hypothetical protein
VYLSILNIAIVFYLKSFFVENYTITSGSFRLSKAADPFAAFPQRLRDYVGNTETIPATTGFENA